MPKHVTPERFLEAWEKAWLSESSKLRQQWIREYYTDSRDHPRPYKTNIFMLGKNRREGFLGRVMANVKKDRTLGITDWIRDDTLLIYHGKASIPVVLEYEPRDHVALKMRNLCTFRSSLKVLVFYDWDEYHINSRRRPWLNTTLREICKIQRQFYKNWGGYSRNHCLFIVGDRKGNKDCKEANPNLRGREADYDTRWRYAIDSPKLQSLVEPRC